MAYFDICSAASYGSFNRKLAQITNTITAVYWAEILAISNKVVKKVTYDANGYFPIDRDYVEKMCAIKLEDQLTCDAILEQLGVLSRNLGDLNSISIDLEKYTTLMIDSGTKKLDIPKDPTKITRAQKSANKQEIIKATMRKLITEQDEDLRAKYFAWVDAVYGASRFLNRNKINLFESAINQFTDDKQVKLELLTSASISGYDNAEWVINNYKKQNKSATKLPEQRATTKVDEFNYF